MDHLLLLNWSTLPFYKKIRIYSKTLTAHHSNYVDKINAKQLAKEQCPEIEVAPIIRILANHEDIHLSDINTNHILKSAHGCGWNHAFTSQAELDIIKTKLVSWNKKYKSDSNEPQYQYIEPRFYIEEKIEDSILGQTSKAIVYMVRCIRGEPVSIGVSHERKMNHYDINWKPISSPNIKIHIPKPKNLEKLIQFARELSKPFEFVRMDFYLSSDNIYLSEYTFTPAGGNPVLSDHLEYSLGAKWIRKK
jgi:hypothetical protein